MLYFDHNATTRPTPDVVAAMRRTMEELWQNPSSGHRAGQAVRQAVDLARRDIGALVGARARDIVFTSGGTESVTLALRGMLGASGRGAAVTTGVEHSAVTHALKGTDVRVAPVGLDGRIDLDGLNDLIDEDVGLVSVQWANNETGVIQPLESVVALCRERGVLLHTDATQYVGKLPVDVAELGVDAMSFSPHKFHGPKGVGVLFLRRGVGLRPLVDGSQELGRRAGTENVPGIVGAGTAAGEAVEWLAQEHRRERVSVLRDRFESHVVEAVSGACVNGAGAPRLWNTTNVGFPGVEAEALLLMLSERGVCASAGASCASGSLEPSPVLLAMGVDRVLAHGSIRFSLGRETTSDEVDEAADLVVECVRRLVAVG